MSGNVGLNLNSNYLYNTGLNTTGNTGLTTNNMFGLNLQPINTDYENDIMMPDFLKSTSYNQQTGFQGQATQTQVPQTQTPQVQVSALPQQVQNVAQNQQQLQQQSIFTGNKNNPQTSQESLNQYIMAQDPSIMVTEKGNLYKQSSAMQKLGTTAGILTPVVAAASKYASKGLKAFTSKSFLIKLPIFGIAGYAIGALADKFINSHRAQKADQVDKV